MHSKAMCMSMSPLSHHLSLMQWGGEREQEAYLDKKIVRGREKEEEAVRAQYTGGRAEWGERESVHTREGGRDGGRDGGREGGREDM